MAVQSLAIFTRKSFDYDEDDDPIGSGAFGAVYKAKRVDTGATVALKVIDAPRKLTKDEKDSFLQEARILNEMNGQHQNIIGFVGISLDPKFYTIVLEFMENDCLEKLLLHNRDDHPLVTQTTCRVRMGRDVAEGMKFLHSRSPSVFHRDLKSANVLVDLRYRCKICDFGLAKMRAVSAKSSRQQGKSLSLAGTIAYIPPERFNGTQTPMTESKGDVYAFAVLLWQLKEMKEPWAGDFQIIRPNVLDGQRPKMNSEDDWPEQLRDITERCWEQDPHRRPSFEDIVKDMEAACPADSSSQRNSSPICQENTARTTNGSVLSGPNSVAHRDSNATIPPVAKRSRVPLQFQQHMGPSNMPTADRDAARANSRLLPETVQPLNPGLEYLKEEHLEDHDLRLQFFWEDLKNHIQVEQILDNMFSCMPSLTMAIKSEIMLPQLQKDRAENLLKWLSHQGKEEYRAFLLALCRFQNHLTVRLTEANRSFDEFRAKAKMHVRPRGPAMAAAAQFPTARTTTVGFYPRPVLSSLSHQEPLPSVDILGAAEDINEISSRGLLIQLSDKLGHIWTFLGRELGLSDAVLENVEADHRTQREQSYYMLIEWTRRRPATRQILYDALLAVDPSGSILQSLHSS